MWAREDNETIYMVIQWRSAMPENMKVATITHDAIRRMMIR